MSKQPNQLLTKRVRSAAGAVMRRNSCLTYPELFIAMGILSPKHYADWKSGRVPFLERVVQSNLTKLARIITAVRRLARELNLQRRIGPRPKQRYSKTGVPSLEEEYRAIYGAFSKRLKESDQLLCADTASTDPSRFTTRLLAVAPRASSPPATSYSGTE